MVDAAEQREAVAEHVEASVVPEVAVSEDVVEPEAVASVVPVAVVSADVVVVVVAEVASEAVAVAAEAIKLQFYQVIKKIKSLFVNKQIRQQYN